MLILTARSVLFLLLTIFTQIGGVVYIISLIISKKVKPFKHFRANAFLIFMVIYLTATFIIVPFTAPLFGRECVTKKIQPASFLTNILNRNYVVKDVNNLLEATLIQLKGTKIEMKYLDANFPFIKGFPLWPHLSHNDGKKIDLSFIYENEMGQITSHNKSNTGYGIFENPASNETDQNKICKSNGNPLYDFSKYLTLGAKNKHLKFSIKGNKQLLKALLAQSTTGKIFIEPHLKQRLKLNNSKIRFQGCKSVRHDDHIHLQIH